MLKRRLPFAPGEVRATSLFVVTAATVAAVVAFAPHTARTTPLPYSAENGKLSMNWFFQRPSVRPVPNAPTYGISTPSVAAGAGAAYTVSAVDVRPLGAPGGRVCVALVATIATSSSSAQTAHECAPLVAGWSRLPAVTLRTTASSRVYAELTAQGNGGGFESRRLTVARIVP